MAEHDVPVERLMAEMEAFWKAHVKSEEYERIATRNSAIREAREDSDRGFGIVMASLLEDELARCLQRCMNCSDQYPVETASLFRHSGPLGSFAVKIDIAAVLGVYSKTVRRELVTIKDIRNTFAHCLKWGKFDAEKIRSLAENLTYIEKFLSRNSEGDWRLTMSSAVHLTFPEGTNPIDTPRRRFGQTCMFYFHALQSADAAERHTDLFR